MPRGSALGLEAYTPAPPPEMALESVLPPAPPQPELISDHAIPLNPLGHASQLALEAVVPKKPAPIAFFLTSLFFFGYVVRAMFGRVVDASAQIGELGREGFLALVVHWNEAGKRARR